MLHKSPLDTWPRQLRRNMRSTDIRVSSLCLHNVYTYNTPQQRSREAIFTSSPCWRQEHTFVWVEEHCMRVEKNNSCGFHPLKLCHEGWVRRRGLEYRSCFCSQSSGANPKFLTYNFTDLHQGQFSWYLLSVNTAALICCPSFMGRSYCIQSSEVGV